jgi:hypothetical protein
VESALDQKTDALSRAWPHFRELAAGTLWQRVANGAFTLMDANNAGKIAPWASWRWEWTRRTTVSTRTRTREYGLARACGEDRAENTAS